ncbi:Translation protein, beta-barrel domain [Pseudocohnilembus persalinus]|uniref:Translation protein, beta-barrel domain n=1 Tax=Pseudocohnilembus persalinus TaxID=266149 RepID=A0A0V0QR03_PSEPJ|nr:Translation protein, beta-barrel domain [Pseudocohnilembus persalinus]|eukprot:KRX04699.1 Translation protein, beta-barrel domain [Pseudocohnilembus persalinus]
MFLPPNQYFGKMLIGRIESGTLNLNDKLSSVDSEGKLVENGKVQKIMKKYGMETIEMQRAVAGDIVSIAGFSNSTVTNTLNEQGKYTVIPSIPIDPPIMSISVNVNTSPLAGKEGKKLSKNQIKQRLKIESENDVALKVEGIDDKVDSNDIVIKGRGDLHLGLLIEKMRREGFELAVSPPIILFKEDENGNLLEPMEKITIECDPMYVPGIMEKLGNRGAIYESAEEISRDLHQFNWIQIRFTQ